MKIFVYIYIYIYGGGGTKSDCMKMYNYEKNEGPHRMILSCATLNFKVFKCENIHF